MKRIASFKKIFRSMVALIVALTMMMPSAVFASEAGRGDDGMVTINVPANIEAAVITVEKEIDGVLVSFDGTKVQSGSDWVTTFRVPIGGSCVVIPGAVGGYVTPPPQTVKLTGLKGSFDITLATLDYEPSGASINSVTVSPATLSLIESQTSQLSATIDPSSSNQAVTWSENSGGTVVSVSASGVVTAIGSGVATVTATSVGDGSKSDSCVVTVGEVTVPELVSLPGTVGIPVVLPDKAYPLVSYNGGAAAAVELDVSWAGATANNTITYNTDGLKTVNGYIPGTTIVIAVLTINVEAGTQPATDITFLANELDLYIGATGYVDFNITPEGASLDDVDFASSDSTKATVALYDENTVVVTASSDPDNGVGQVLITAYLGDPENVLDSFYVYISIDPTAIEIPSIVATSALSDEAVDIFETAGDVYINYYGLKAGHYFIKIEDKGSKTPLGQGEIEINYQGEETVETGATGKFRLLDILTGFTATLKYSASYFVSMSTDHNYPSGDYADGTPKTLADNFKITSPVPTTLLDNIQVLVTEANGNNGVLAAIMADLGVSTLEVILGRIIDEDDILGIQFEDYLLPGSTVAEPLYSDEVKLKGTVGADGVVTWQTPVEKLKIGGYILLIQIPGVGTTEGAYDTNLDSRNIDGTYLKEVHVTRNGTVVRNIIVSYVR